MVSLMFLENMMEHRISENRMDNIADYPMILEYRIKNNGFGIIANRMENSGLSKDIETRMENNL